MARPTHYCKCCGLDMKAREERFCRDRDGDFCEPSKYLPLRELKANHPRVVEETRRWRDGGCRHRPKCCSVAAHIRRMPR